jgi:hypothetical protein
MLHTVPNKRLRLPRCHDVSLKLSERAAEAQGWVQRLSWFTQIFLPSAWRLITRRS